MDLLRGERAMVHRWMRKWLSRLALRNERGYDKGSEQRGVPVRQRHVRLFVEMLEDRNLLSVHIQFDFSHDFNNFFSANPQAQTTLQAAADQLTSSITTSLSAISPGGTNTWTAITFEPSNTAQQLQISNLNVPADTLIVFAGGENLSAGSSELGQGGPGGFNAQGSSAFLSTVSTRGQTGAAATPPTGFGPWGGSITFATNPSGGW